MDCPPCTLDARLKHTQTHSEAAHNVGCRCASSVLKLADFEDEAHLPRYQEADSSAPWRDKDIKFQSICIVPEAKTIMWKSFLDDSPSFGRV